MQSLLFFIEVMWIIFSVLTSDFPLPCSRCSRCIDPLGFLKHMCLSQLGHFEPTFPLPSTFSKQFFTWCYFLILQFKHQLRSQTLSCYLKDGLLYSQSMWVFIAASHRASSSFRVLTPMVYYFLSFSPEQELHEHRECVWKRSHSSESMLL